MAQYNYPKRKRSEWLIMVYLAGDNNLSASSIGFLQELEAAKHDKDVRVVAGFDPNIPLPAGARYLEIKRHLDPENPENPYLKRMDWPLHNDLMAPGHVVVSPDFCKPQPTQYPHEPVANVALARFFDWVRKYYKARKYMLILFGHGPLVAGNTFLMDTTPPSFLKLTDFSKILRKHFRKRLSILACNNCVMNGIETATELYGQVDYMIGSQGLMLVNGWPFRKIIEEVVDHYDKDPAYISEKVLKVCARNLLDFTLMERSSEQAIINVNKFGRERALVDAIRELSGALQDGLGFKPQPKEGELKYPIIRDVVRLARLEAQAYWAEQFVDLYDFCELLLLRCNDVLCNLQTLVQLLFLDCIPKCAPGITDKSLAIKECLDKWPPIPRLRRIAKACKEIIGIFQTQQVVTRAYYVCPQLQYSHGVSIYFPWTLPEGPITFEPYGSDEPTLMTPFDQYKEYEFGKANYGDWVRTLEAFFRATLRNVRRVEYEYKPDDVVFFRGEVSAAEGVEFSTPAIDLLKSGSSSGDEDEFDFPRIKNYPRRFYLSPADCKRRMKILGPGFDTANNENVIGKPGEVSYLGWNIRGFMAEVIGLPPGGKFPQEQPPCPEFKR
jgi:hypothetical protein